jgi:hypothetical protein
VLAKRNEREIAQQQPIKQIFSRAAFARPAKRQMHKTHTHPAEEYIDFNNPSKLLSARLAY